MKKRFIIANWKSNETFSQVEQWFKVFVDANVNWNAEEKVVIVCPPFTYLPKVKELIQNHKLNIGIGGQDVSPFEAGAYTGEVNASQIKEYADYAIIGHSERRKYFHEDDTLLKQKVDMAHASGLMPIYCVQDENTSIPQGVTLAAYEPIFAIGSGQPDTPENAQRVIQAIKQSNPHVKFVLYGGSVNGENVGGFTQSESIDGSLVGGASLDASKFISIIENS